MAPRKASCRGVSGRVGSAWRGRRITSSHLLPFEDELRAALGDHYDRCVGVARDQDRHDRGIAEPISSSRTAPPFRRRARKAKAGHVATLGPKTITISRCTKGRRGGARRARPLTAASLAHDHPGRCIHIGIRAYRLAVHGDDPAREIAILDLVGCESGRPPRA